MCPNIDQQAIEMAQFQGIYIESKMNYSMINE